jgi:hypothetical protein
MVVDLMREGVWRRGGGDLAHPAHVTLSFLARVLLRVRVYRQLMPSQNPDAISFLSWSSFSQMRSPPSLRSKFYLLSLKLLEFMCDSRQSFLFRKKPTCMAKLIKYGEYSPSYYIIQRT